MRRLVLALALLGPSAARAAAPAASGWPMHHHDYQHTSTAAYQGFTTPRVLWTKDLGTSVRTPTKHLAPSIDSDGTIYTSGGDKVFAISPAGATIWTSTLPMPDVGALGPNGWSQPVVGNGTEIYVSSFGMVAALSKATGAPQWYRAIDSNAPVPGTSVSSEISGSMTWSWGEGSMVMGPDGKLYATSYGEASRGNIGNSQGMLCLTSTGGVSWARIYNGATYPGALSPDGTTVYFKTVDMTLWAVGTATGARVWSVATNSNDLDTQGVSVGPSGTVYTFANNPNNNLRAINPATGATIWNSTRAYGVTYGFPPAIASDGSIYVGAFDGTDRGVTGVDSAGNEFVHAAIPNATYLGPITIAGGTIYLVAQVNGFQNYLVAMNRTTGQVLWMYYYPEMNLSDPPAVAVSTGVIYIHDSSVFGNRLYALGVADSASLQVSSAAASASGNLWVTTVTATVRNGSLAPVAAVPVGQTVTGTANISPGAPFTNTNLAGQTTFQLYWDLAFLAHSAFQSLNSTVSLEAIGLPSQSILIQDQSASTFTLTLSTPSIEDGGSGVIRVTTITFTVSNSTGGRVPNFPVALEALDYTGDLGGLCGVPASITPASNFQLTNSTGQVAFVHRLRISGGAAGFPCVSVGAYQNFQARVAGYALGLPSVTVDTREKRIASYTVSFSTGNITPDIRSTTMTVTVYDAFGSTVPNAVVALHNLPTVPASVVYKYLFKAYNPMSACTQPSTLPGYTDSFGNATFFIGLSELCSGASDYDDFNDTTINLPVFPLNVAPSTPTVFLESNYLDHFSVQAPTEVAVGIAFSSTYTALNKWNNRISLFQGGFIPLTPLIAGTAVQGGGTLAQTVVDFTNQVGTSIMEGQNYNEIESIQLKITRALPSPARTGLSGAINILGPDRFIVEIPTGSVAGQQFVSTITAVDKNGVQIAGYSGTLSLTALQAGNTTQAATGSLGVTNINLPSTGRVTFTNQTYNKGEGIRIRAYDSALGVEGVSSSMTVTLPSLSISHYRVSVPTQVTVGVPFRAQFIALDASSNPVTYQLSRSLNIQALLSLSPEISGSGSLGTSASSLAAGTTNTLITNQTYNKIQTVYIKVTDEDGRVGISTNAVVFSGPTQFDVTIGTYALAGVQFQMIVTARDGGGQQVLGYDGTVNVAAVQASNTALSGAGILGVTSLNLAGGLGVSPFQTYTKAEGIRLRLTDSAINVTSYSSSMTVRAGPAASLSVSANPQSTVASVPSVLTTTVLDQYSNAVQGSTVTYSVVAGSGVLSLSLSGGAVVSAVTTTNSVTDASGQAGAFFGSTNTLSSQANLLRVTLGSLLSDTTIYNAVLISPAGGAIVNLADPRIRVDCPANAWSFSIRMSAQSRNELSAADLALTTAAFAAQSNVFVSTVVAKLSAVRDSNPNLSAGNSPTKVNLSLPVEIDVSSQVTVGSYRGQSLLVPLSVLRIFKLNQATSLFEMVLDGTNLADLSSRTVTAQLADPNGIYAIGAPPFTSLGSGSSGTVTAVLAAGATATVDVPFGAFAAATNLQVGVPSAASVPSLPANRGMTGTGLTISIQTTNSLQPIRPVSVTIGYRAQDVVGLNPDHLRLARYDEATGWVVLDSSVDTITRKVTGETDHFSLFQVVAVAPHADLSSGIVFPNPFRPNAGHTMLKFGQLPALAKIRIFTVSGRMLKQLETDATGQVLSWDAKDKDGNALPSGVYLALVESGDSRKTLKFAIQR